MVTHTQRTNIIKVSAEALPHLNYLPSDMGP